MKVLDLDRNAPPTLRAAAVVAVIAGLLWAVFLIVQFSPMVVLLPLWAPSMLRVPGIITRLEPWMYWYNVILCLPVLLLAIAFLFYVELAGMMSSGGLEWAAIRIFTWLAVAASACASLLLAAPSSKRAADSARTLNGVPVH